MKTLLTLLLVSALSSFVKAASIDEVFSAVNSNNVEVLNDFLQQGGNPNSLDNSGNSFLYIATGPKGGFEVLELLLMSGADPDLGSKYGYTPLMNSASWCDLKNVKLLIQYNADIEKINSRGQSALDTVCFKGRNREQVIQLLQNVTKR